jgi:hypothetical protein
VRDIARRRKRSPQKPSSDSAKAEEDKSPAATSPDPAARAIREQISSVLEAASDAAAEIEKKGESDSAERVLAQMTAVDRELGRARRNIKKEAAALRAAAGAAAGDGEPAPADDSDAAPSEEPVPEDAAPDEITASVREKSDDELAEIAAIAAEAKDKAEKASDEKMTAYWQALYDAAVVEAARRPEFGKGEPDPALGRRERKRRAKGIQALVDASQD